MNGAVLVVVASRYIWWWLDAWLGCSQWGTYLFFWYIQVYIHLRALTRAVMHVGRDMI